MGDDEQAIIMYEVTSSPFGGLTCGERVTVRDGKIRTDLLVFDTFPIRTVHGERKRMRWTITDAAPSLR